LQKINRISVTSICITAFTTTIESSKSTPFVEKDAEITFLTMGRRCVYRGRAQRMSLRELGQNVRNWPTTPFLSSAKVPRDGEAEVCAAGEQA
jgi:hypothetical protein